VGGGELLKQAIKRRMEGKRQKRRARIRMIDDLRDNSYVEMKMRVENRDTWRHSMPRTWCKAETE